MALFALSVLGMWQAFRLSLLANRPNAKGVPKPILSMVNPRNEPVDATTCQKLARYALVWGVVTIAATYAGTDVLERLDVLPSSARWIPNALFVLAAIHVVITTILSAGAFLPDDDTREDR